MSHSDVIEELQRVLAQEVQSDSVGLWALVWELKQRLPSVPVAEARMTVLAVVGAAIERGNVVPGDFVEMRFVPWGISSHAALERIESAWIALGRDPDIGEIVWFAAATRPH